jgi:hypothetical protein
MVTDHIEFTSSYFLVESGEDAATNPGIYGKALAQWVADKLRARGVCVEGEVVAEDFGRCVIVSRKPYMLWVACANVDGSTTRWQMFIALELGLTGVLLHRADSSAAVESLREHYSALVRELPGAVDVLRVEQ